MAWELTIHDRDYKQRKHHGVGVGYTRNWIVRCQPQFLSEPGFLSTEHCLMSSHFFGYLDYKKRNHHGVGVDYTRNWIVRDLNV